MNTTMQSEHDHSATIDALAPLSEMTHVAVTDGDWSNPNTWQNGNVPDSEANVHIPHGISVVYDVDSSVPLGTVRNDGTLSWATDTDTKMLVETIVTGSMSTTEFGSQANGGIDSAYTAEIIFRDTPIDTAADPEMLSHGLVAAGQVNILGAEKESFVEIQGNTVSAGATSVTLEGDLTNWEIGDEILFVGTGNGSQDETRTITSVNGNTVTFDAPLNHNHQPPAGFDFDVFVGNLTRNVVFSSENPEGTRGHVMFMNGEAYGGETLANSLQYAEFTGLGRTDQSIEVGTSSNPTGRYPFHFHETGTDPDSPSSLAEGIAVNGSPGWGITHHSSNATITDSIVYDTVGGGMVSEDGDETGVWARNLVSSVEGTNISVHDGPGNIGAAFESQSRVIIQQGNIAANSEVGWSFSSHENFPEDEGTGQAPQEGIHRSMFERGQVTFDPSPFDVSIDHEEPALTDFNNNTSIATTDAFVVFHRQFSDDTDTMSVIDNFTVWGGSNAVLLQNYASNYEFTNSTWQGSGTGFSIFRKTSSAVLNDVEMHGFDYGYRSWGANHEVALIDTEFHNVGTEFDLADLMRAVDSSSARNELISYFRDEHGIDYTNPMPQIFDSSTLTPVSEVVFTAGANADLTIGPDDRSLTITGTITDALGTRNFNEYVIAKPPSGSGTSKDFEGVTLNFVTEESPEQKEFTVEQFLTLHGAFQKADGTWVSPVVNWITERLSGDQHPVIIEINLEGFTDAELAVYELDAYPDPGINNPGWYEENLPVIDPTGEGLGTGPNEPESNQNLTLSSPDTLIETVEESAAVFSVSGLDAGSNAIVTVTDSAGDSVDNSASPLTVNGIVTLELSNLQDGFLNVSVTATDDSGVTRTVTGPVVTLDIEDELPTDPEPVNPEPTDLDPVNPDLVNPEPTDLEPVNPGPVNPEPTDLDPVNPEPDGTGGGESSSEPVPTIEGTSIGDVLLGTGSADVMVGFDGNDSITGRGDDDWLSGGAGNDTLLGGGGNDTLNGGAGVDKLVGYTGADVFQLHASELDGDVDSIWDFDPASGDRIELHSFVPKGIAASKIGDYLRYESSGNDGVLSYDPSGNGTSWSVVAVVRDGGSYTLPDLLANAGLTLVSWSPAEVTGEEEISPTMTPDTSADVEGNLAVSAPDTAISAGEESAVAFSIAGLDADASAVVTVVDSVGNSVTNAATPTWSDGSLLLDLSDLADGALAVSVTATDTTGNVATVGGSDLFLDTAVTLPQPDALMGTSGNDMLRDGSASTEIIGLGGNDRLIGNSGDDTLLGGEGNDLLRGDQGDDILEGGAGFDSLRGQDGADTFVFSLDALDGSYDRIDNFSGANGDGDVIDLSGIASAFGWSAAEANSYLSFTTHNRGVYLELETPEFSQTIADIRDISIQDISSDDLAFA